MLFSDFRILCQDIFSEADPFVLIQKAYVDCVSKIRLFPVVFPIEITGGCGFDGWNDKHQKVSSTLGISNSEICFKEIFSILNVSFLNEKSTVAYVKNPAKVGTFDNDIYGTTLEYVEDEKFSWIGSDLVPIDRESAIVEIVGYAYPYFCYTTSGPDVQRHMYDISAMVALYGESNLIIDDLLGVLTAIKAIELRLMGNADVSRSANVEYYYDKFLNMYNANNETFYAHGFDSLGVSVPGLK